MGFYSKERQVSGVRIRAHAVVSDRALEVAGMRVDALLAGCPQVRDNLAAAGAELHIIGRDQAVTDLPMYRHMKGVPFAGSLTMDQRGRGYGGLFACTAEESLLKLPSARHADHRDVCTHELAHTVQDYGLDAGQRARIVARHGEIAGDGLWTGAYAATNPSELWAELSMWYAGSHGDFGRIAPTPMAGRTWLRAYDPASFALLHGIYGGRDVPEPFSWVEPPVSTARVSKTGPSTSFVFVSELAEPAELAWIDYEGVERPYGTVPAGGVVSQSTYVTHLWRVRRGDRVLGTWAAGAGPCRVVLREPWVA
ncbi:MAG: hypothetical protein R3F61_09505 [Myxococcota bacterium]